MLKIHNHRLKRAAHHLGNFDRNFVGAAGDQHVHAKTSNHEQEYFL